MRTPLRVLFAKACRYATKTCAVLPVLAGWQRRGLESKERVSIVNSMENDERFLVVTALRLIFGLDNPRMLAGDDPRWQPALWQKETIEAEVARRGLSERQARQIVSGAGWLQRASKAMDKLFSSPLESHADFNAQAALISAHLQRAWTELCIAQPRRRMRRLPPPDLPPATGQTKN